MKAIILGGGYGRRLFGKYNPKSYLPKGLSMVGDKPAINYGVDGLIKIFEVDSIFIITNQENEPFYKKWLKDFGYKKIKIISEHQSVPEKSIGVVASAIYTIEKTGFRDDFIVLAPDNVFEFEPSKLINFYHKMGDNNVVAIYNIKNKTKAKEHGVVTIARDSKIKRFEEKPFNPFSTLIVAFFYVLKKEILKELNAWIKLPGSDPDRFGDFIKWTMKKYPLYGYKFKGKWFDTGTPESLELARKYFENKVNNREQRYGGSKYKKI